MMEAFIIVLFVIGMLSLVAWAVYGARWLLKYVKEKSEASEDGEE